MSKKPKAGRDYAAQAAAATILKKLRSKRGATIEQLADGRAPHHRSPISANKPVGQDL